MIVSLILIQYVYCHLTWKAPKKKVNLRKLGAKDHKAAKEKFHFWQKVVHYLEHYLSTKNGPQLRWVLNWYSTTQDQKLNYN